MLQRVDDPHPRLSLRESREQHKRNYGPAQHSAKTGGSPTPHELLQDLRPRGATRKKAATYATSQPVLRKSSSRGILRQNRQMLRDWGEGGTEVPPFLPT